MVAEYKCSAINANLKATVGQLSDIEPLVAASNVCLGAREEDAWAAGQLAASDSASEGGAAADRVMAYLGGPSGEGRMLSHALPTQCNH